ncbi:hypothetical protein Tco_1100050 [Tanacetum coccineum]
MNPSPSSLAQALFTEYHLTECYSLSCRLRLSILKGVQQSTFLASGRTWHSLGSRSLRPLLGSSSMCFLFLLEDSDGACSGTGAGRAN